MGVVWTNQKFILNSPKINKNVNPKVWISLSLSLSSRILSNVPNRNKQCFSLYVAMTLQRLYIFSYSKECGRVTLCLDFVNIHMNIWFMIVCLFSMTLWLGGYLLFCTQNEKVWELRIWDTVVLSVPGSLHLVSKKKKKKGSLHLKNCFALFLFFWKTKILSGCLGVCFKLGHATTPISFLVKIIQDI